MGELTLDGPTFVERSIAAEVSRFCDFTGSCLPPFPGSRQLTSIAKAIERVFLRRVTASAYEIGSVAIRTEADQITRVTRGTFDAMADAARHSQVWVASVLPSTGTRARIFRLNDEATENRYDPTAFGYGTRTR